MIARPLLLVGLMVLSATCAGAKEKRTQLSDHLFVENGWRGVLVQRPVERLLVRDRSGSFTRIAEVEKVVVSRDGRSAVFKTGPWTDLGKEPGQPGIHRYVVGRGDILIYPMAELGSTGLYLHPPLDSVLRVAFKDPARNARGTPWMINGDGDVSPLILHGASPLHAAAYEGRLTTIDSLLHAGADRNATTPFRMYPAELAFLVGQDEAVLRLLDEDARSEADLRAVLREATLAGRASVVEAMLKRGGDANLGLRVVLRLSDSTYQASRDNRYQFGMEPDSILASLRRFLDHGADPNSRNTRTISGSGGGLRPLHAVAQDPFDWLRRPLEADSVMMEMGRLLIERGADPTIRDDKGNTPLHYLVAEGGAGHEPKTPEDVPEWERGFYHRFLELLVGQGNDLEVRNTDGHTPLQRAVLYRDFSVARYLVARGASDAVQVNGSSVREILDREHRTPVKSK